jgi:type IV pilus assembly protein PilA
MGTTSTWQQHWRHYFIGYAAAIAFIFICFSISACAAQDAPPAQPGAPWDQYLQKHPGLGPEFAQLLEKLQRGIQFPPPRHQSRLLPLLPQSTTLYAAFPNYGDASHQALAIFQQELKDSAVLRDWWQHGEMAAAAPKTEDSFDKFYQLSQFFGDEIVISGSIAAHQDHPSLLMVAEARKPGLKPFLQQMVNDLAGKSKPDVRVLDLQQLSDAKDNENAASPPAQELLVLVRPDFIVAALDLTTLRSFNARLERQTLERQTPEFASTPFAQRLEQAYQGGAEVLAAADLQKLLKEMPQGPAPNQDVLQRSGFSDMKYLVWEHKSAPGQPPSQTELSFTGPRRGVASWLAAPAPLNSLDFVSPKAIFASTILLKNLGEVFDDVKGLATASNPNALAMLDPMEQSLHVSLKDDLLRHLSGEITVELDSVSEPAPVWKAILRVNDPDHVQATFAKLLATAPVVADQSAEGGVTYHSLSIPSPQKPLDIAYAFVDGYLVIGSSRDTVVDAVRLHRSGESLAKSKKFLAAMPPGHSTEASALMYQDPIAMTALRLRALSPQMADSLSHLATDSTPAVVCAYAEPNAIRGVSSSGGVDAGVILLGAAIAIPNLLRAKTSANESAAVGTLRTLDTAQITYSVAYPDRGYARDLATLGPDLSDPDAVSADHASLIDLPLGNAICTATTWCTKSGFRFRMTPICRTQPCKEFVAVGTPLPSNQGVRSFCSTSDGVVRVKLGPPVTLPLTPSQCRSWPPLQ